MVSIHHLIWSVHKRKWHQFTLSQGYLNGVSPNTKKFNANKLELIVWGQLYEQITVPKRTTSHQKEVALHFPGGDRINSGRRVVSCGCNAFFHKAAGFPGIHQESQGLKVLFLTKSISCQKKSFASV